MENTGVGRMTEVKARVLAKDAGAAIFELPDGKKLTFEMKAETYQALPESGAGTLRYKEVGGESRFYDFAAAR